MLNINGNSEHLRLFPALLGVLLVFPIKHDVDLGIWEIYFILLRKYPFFELIFLNQKLCWILSNGFSVSLEHKHVLFFLHLIYCVIYFLTLPTLLTNFLIFLLLSHLCIPGTNPHEGSWNLRTHTHTDDYKKVVGIDYCWSLFVRFLCPFYLFHKKNLEVFLVFLCSKPVKEHRNDLSFKVW